MGEYAPKYTQISLSVYLKEHISITKEKVNYYINIFSITAKKRKINFSNTKIKKSPSGKFLVALHKKKINWQFFLHQTSKHPEILKQSVSFSQVWQTKRICTTRKLLKINLKYLQNGWSKKHTLRMKQNNIFQRQTLLKEHSH